MKVTETWSLLDLNDMHDRIMAERAQNKSSSGKTRQDLSCTNLAQHEPDSIHIDMLLFSLSSSSGLLLLFLSSLQLLPPKLLIIIIIYCYDYYYYYYYYFH